MNIEKIQRSEETKTKASNVMVVLTADEGKKLINQDWIDYKNGVIEDIPELLVCTTIYLCDADSVLDYAEINEEQASEYNKEYLELTNSNIDA